MGEVESEKFVCDRSLKELWGVVKSLCKLPATSMSRRLFFSFEKVTLRWALISICSRTPCAYIFCMKCRRTGRACTSLQHDDSIPQAHLMHAIAALPRCCIICGQLRVHDALCKVAHSVRALLLPLLLG